MYCRQCGEKLNNPKAVICVKCGTNKGQGENYCPDCGQEVKNKDAEVCLNCGVRLKGAMNNFISKANSNSSSNNNNKVVAGFLAIFLGAMGIHRFYLGYKQIGFIQLGIFGVAMLFFLPILWVNLIWAIIDAIQIFTGKLYNANGTQLV